MAQRERELKTGTIKNKRRTKRPKKRLIAENKFTGNENDKTDD